MIHLQSSTTNSEQCVYVIAAAFSAVSIRNSFTFRILEFLVTQHDVKRYKFDLAFKRIEIKQYIHTSKVYLRLFWAWSTKTCIQILHGISVTSCITNFCSRNDMAEAEKSLLFWSDCFLSTNYLRFLLLMMTVKPNNWRLFFHAITQFILHQLWIKFNWKRNCLSIYIYDCYRFEYILNGTRALKTGSII